MWCNLDLQIVISYFLSKFYHNHKQMLGYCYVTCFLFMMWEIPSDFQGHTKTTELLKVYFIYFLYTQTIHASKTFSVLKLGVCIYPNGNRVRVCVGVLPSMLLHVTHA